MGCVYKAVDLRLNNVVALKKMLPPAGGALDKHYSEERFREEGKLLSQLHHSGLPKVSDYFSSLDPDTGKPAHFIVMTFIPGKDLETLIHQKGAVPFAVDETLIIFRQLLHILTYLHGQKPPIINRDINPRNIMLHDGRVFLVDFGIARIFAPQQKATQIGTPGYAPIEQAKGYAEPRSDLYALAAVIHYLLTGVNPEDPARPPFHFEPVYIYNTAVPGALNSLLMEMVRDKCADRPPSAHQVLNRLDGLTQKTPSVSSPAPRAATTQPQLTAHLNYTNIFEAISKNDSGAVNAFLLRGVDYRARNTSGNPPLHSAAAMGRKDIVALLLQNKAPVNLKNSRGETALHKAADTNRHVIAGMLLAQGAGVDEKNVTGWTPLHYAAAKGHKRTVDQLIARGANINAAQRDSWRPLHFAAHKGSLEVVMALVNRGADVDMKEHEGWTALHLACQEGHMDVVRLLVSHRALINTREAGGSTPLHTAVLKEHRRLVEYLIQEGAQVDALNKTGLSPLDLARQKGNQEITALLRIALSTGRGGQAGITAPLAAVPGAFTPEEQQCIARTSQYSDIFESVAQNDMEATHGFLLSGIKVNSRQNARTPLARAVELGFADMAEFLIGKGAHVNDRFEKGDTLLHMTAQSGDKKMTELLIRWGARVNARNKEGKAPLQVAKNETIKKVLRTSGAKLGWLWW
jgi:ankyrin repeat protein